MPTRKNTAQPTPDATDRVIIRKLTTGVPGLDEILGGGLPEYSFNIVAGAPGAGKTTLAHQIVFANVTAERPVIYFTVLGEPAIKMLRYQQQYTFDGGLRFINRSQAVLADDLGAVLDLIVKEVESSQAAMVVVDSFRTVVRKAQSGTTNMDLQVFVQRLALPLTSWQATTFLSGEYLQKELRDSPVFTVADRLFWLHQNIERNSVVRKLQVMKLRGQESVPGLHTFRITQNGLQCFPRTFGLTRMEQFVKGRHRLSTGAGELDALMGGGIPAGDSLLLGGPSGSGKSLLASQFIAAGLRKGEPAIVTIFEELPSEYIERGEQFGFEFSRAEREGRLKVIYLRPLDLSVDETVHEIVGAVRKMGCQRMVIDSLVGFEMALAPGFRAEFRESLYRMIIALSRLGVTIFSTVEVEDNFTSMALTNYSVSFLADDILRLRYISIDGRLRKMLIVVKMRRSRHSIDLYEYEITPKGVVIGEALRGYRALTSGIPALSAGAPKRLRTPTTPPKRKAKRGE